MTRSSDLWDDSRAQVSRGASTDPSDVATDMVQESLSGQARVMATLAAMNGEAPDHETLLKALVPRRTGATYPMAPGQLSAAIAGLGRQGLIKYQEDHGHPGHTRTTNIKLTNAGWQMLGITPKARDVRKPRRQAPSVAPVVPSVVTVIDPQPHDLIPDKRRTVTRPQRDSAAFVDRDDATSVQPVGRDLTRAYLLPNQTVGGPVTRVHATRTDTLTVESGPQPTHNAPQAAPAPAVAPAVSYPVLGALRARWDRWQAAEAQRSAYLDAAARLWDTDPETAEQLLQKGADVGGDGFEQWEMEYLRFARENSR